ncbi:MAG: AAA family ATPase [Candidatus Cryosericum sp.]|nr:ATP-binding protein [bacterium]
MSAHVILISGPRAAGKSTFAAELHETLAGSVLLHVDDLFHQVLAQERQRWNGKEIVLYAMVVQHQLAFARDLATLDTVIVDGTVLPDQLAPLLEPPAPDASIIVLLPSLEQCLANEHRATRTVPVREEKVRTTWLEMQGWRDVKGVPVRIVDGTEMERRKALAAALERLQQAP